MSNFVVITVPTNALAHLGAGTSADIVMTKPIHIWDKDLKG